MKVLRVFNNNVVMAEDPHRGTVIVTGRGVGFSRKPGDSLDTGKIVQVFVPDAENDISYLSTYLVDVPRNTSKSLARSILLLSTISEHLFPKVSLLRWQITSRLR